MQPRTVLVALVLVVAACGGRDGDGPSGAFSSAETEAAAKSTTTTSVDGAAPAVTTADAPATTNTEPPATTTIVEAPPALGSRTDPLPVGSVARVGDWVIRVASVTPDGTEQVMTFNDFNDPPGPGEQFFLAAFEATYVGTESSTFWFDVGLKVVGPAGVAYDSFDAWCGSIPDDITNAGETFRGGTIIGNACWRVDGTEAADLVLIAEPLLVFGDGDRAFMSLDATATPIDGSTAIVEAGPVTTEAVPIGETAAVGDWVIRVVSVIPDATDEVLAHNSFNDPPGPGELMFIAQIEAGYEGEESATFWFDVTMKPVGAANVAYESFEAYCGVVPDDITDIGEVFPGGAIAGNACWRIDAADADSLVLSVEAGPFGDERVFFALTG